MAVVPDYDQLPTLNYHASDIAHQPFDTRAVFLFDYQACVAFGLRLGRWCACWSASAGGPARRFILSVF
jgi:hypothetical protein